MKLAIRLVGMLLVFITVLTIHFSLPDVAAQNSAIKILDIFGRDISQQGITLVDWEGMIRNPALKFSVSLPAGAIPPARVTLTANHPRLYFDRPSTVTEFGPSKAMQNLTENNPQAFHLSIFPDRDFENEQYTLTVQVTDRNNQRFRSNITILIIDQDIDRPVEYPLIVDFSKDPSDFFENAQARAVVETAAADWAYFLADMNFDPVPAGAAFTLIPNANRSGNQEAHGDDVLINSAPYEGFLLYAGGFDSFQNLTSTGFASVHRLQRSGGRELPIWTSGAISMNPHGNFNTNGWQFSLEDDDWFNVDVPADFYQIVSHEMGHALFFFGGYPLYAEAASFRGGRGFFQDPDLLAYHGSNPTVVDEHLTDGYVDRLSLQEPYGGGCSGGGCGRFVQQGRGLATKLDLLIIKSIGYELRETSAFVPLSVGDYAIPEGMISVPYSGQLSARGGVPFYHWEHISGDLPDGLELTSFGELQGTPNTNGIFRFTVQALDYDEMSEPVSYEACMIVRDENGSEVNGSCPDLPMMPEVVVPKADRDGDGVLDEDDACPDFAGRPETDGC